MLKVMHVLNTGKYSGAENVAITIINSMKNVAEATYVSLNGPIKEYLRENDINYFPIQKLTISRIKTAIKECQPDIIHAHDFTAGIICAASGTNIPIVNHIHNNSPWIKRYCLKSFLFAVSCFRYKRILTVSDSVMNEYVFGGWFKNKTEVVGNPIDINKVRNLAGDNVKKIYDIAFLGRLSYPKNPHFFLDIVADLKKRIPHIRAIMIGDGELRNEVENHITNENLNENINVVGFQKNPYQYLKQAKILLMPSVWEGFGLAAIEALALGIPVLCSSVGGLPNIVDDACGKICKEKKEYSDMIIQLLNDECLYEMESQGAFNRAKCFDNLSNYSTKMLNLYRTVCKVRV